MVTYGRGNIDWFGNGYAIGGSYNIGSGICMGYGIGGGVVDTSWVAATAWMEADSLVYTGIYSDYLWQRLRPLWLLR